MALHSFWSKEKKANKIYSDIRAIHCEYSNKSKLSIGGGGLLSLLNREKPLVISWGLDLSYISGLDWFANSFSPGQFLFLDWSNPPGDKEWELCWQQLWGDVDGDDDIGDDDVDNLKDGIGVLGGGWLSLPLLTGQRRSATIIISESPVIIFSFNQHY